MTEYLKKYEDEPEVIKALKKVARSNPRSGRKEDEHKRMLREGWHISYGKNFMSYSKGMN